MVRNAEKSRQPDEGPVKPVLEIRVAYDTPLHLSLGYAQHWDVGAVPIFPRGSRSGNSVL